MEDRTVIEWDKDDLDTWNILKVDVLGLGMLSCLRRGFDLIEKHYGDEAHACEHPGRGERGLQHAVARGLHRRLSG